MPLNVTLGKVVKNNLGYLGTDFQYRLISTFFVEPNFFKDMYPIIDQNMFTESYLKTIVGIMKDYYAKYDSTASYDIVLFKLREKALTEDDVQCYEEVIEKLKKTSTEGIEEIEELAEKFFKQQNWIRVANEIKRIAGDGDVSKYDDCQRLMEEAMSIGRQKNEAYSPFDNIDEDLSKESVVTIPTGVKSLDEVLGGGLDKGKIGLIIGPSSFGKVQPNDAKIVTPDGFKNMGEIKVGDKVIGRDGKEHNVIGVFPHKNWQFYRVTFSDGVSCECGKEHLWAVNSLYQRSGKKYISGLSKHRDDKYYAPDNSFKVLSLDEIMKKGVLKGKNQRHNFKIPMCNPVNFSEKPIELDPYLLGVFIGDGCFKRCEISIGTKDIDEFEKNLHRFKHSTSFHKRNDNGYCLYTLRFGKETQRCLDNIYGGDSTIYNSGNKYIPLNYLFNSLENRILLLNGLMDTDGTCQKNGCCCYNTKSRQLAEDIKTLVLSLGGFAKIREKKAGYFNKKLNKQVDCGIHYEVTITLCDPSIPIFKLKRKQERVHYRALRKGERFIHSVEPSRVCDGQCIKVDADDELYLTDDFIVTHNTSMTTGFAAYEATYKCEANDFQGFKVLQIVFEDSNRDINRKYFSRFSQVETRVLNKDEETTEYVRDLIKNHPDFETVKNNIRVMHLDTGEYTATDIKGIIKKKINEGFKPDVVVIDYFECIEPEKGTSKLAKWDQETKTMRKLENYAKELNVALWLPTQGNRSSLTSEVVTMDQGSGSLGKIQIAQVVLSIARSIDDVNEQRATIAVLKNRSGGAGMIMQDIIFNNGTCTISSDDVIDFSNPREYREYNEQQKSSAIDDLRSGNREYVK